MVQKSGKPVEVGSVSTYLHLNIPGGAGSTVSIIVMLKKLQGNE